MTSATNVKGFTLVELLIVLVIMSLLLSLVPPLLSNVMPSVTIKATANDLYHDLKYVRNMAVLSGRQSSIVIDTVNSSYSSESKDNGKIIKLPSDIRITVENAQLQQLTEENQIISFFADGSSSGGVVLLNTDDQIFTITVDWLIGKVSLVKG